MSKSRSPHAQNSGSKANKASTSDMRKECKYFLIGLIAAIVASVIAVTLAYFVQNGDNNEEFNQTLVRMQVSIM